MDEAVHSGQLSPSADLEATIDLLMAIIVFVGTTRQDVARIPAVVAVLRHGVASEATGGPGAPIPTPRPVA